MFRTAFIPAIISCVIYFILGFFAGGGGDAPDLKAMFAKEFSLHWLSVVPAVVILAFSLLKIKTRYAMLASLASAMIVSLTVQNVEITEFFKIIITGFEAKNAELSHMMNGGGLVSMLNATAIVCISSAYSGIFAATGLLNSLKSMIEKLSRRVTPFGATLITSALTSLISCNQTLAIILAHQLCEGTEKDKETEAINLENTAVVVSPLVPWSIAGSVPLTSAGAPVASMLAAVFLYILPLWSLMIALIRRRKERKENEKNNKLYC